MSIEQQRIIEAQQKQIKQLTKELSTARQAITDAHDSLPAMTQATRVSVARKTLAYYLSKRGLLK